MNTLKFRFTFALVVSSVLSMAALAELARAASVDEALACPGGESGQLSGMTEGGGSSGGDIEVRWSSLIPGSFK